jgi:hypothetical protein
VVHHPRRFETGDLGTNLAVVRIEFGNPLPAINGLTVVGAQLIDVAEFFEKAPVFRIVLHGIRVPVLGNFREAEVETRFSHVGVELRVPRIDRQSNFGRLIEGRPVGL